MIEKIIDRMINNMFFRQVVTLVGVTLPIGLTTCWLGAAYLNAWLGVGFLSTLLGLFFFGMLGGFPIGLLLWHAAERWIIRDRALQSLGWTGVRVLLGLLVAIPSGFGILFAVRAGLRVYPPLIEMIYFVQTGAITFITVIVYTLLEHGMQEIKRREARLKMKIEAMQIEINELKRQEQVDEISSSEFFQELQQKADRLRQSTQSLDGE